MAEVFIYISELLIAALCGVQDYIQSTYNRVEQSLDTDNMTTTTNSIEPRPLLFCFHVRLNLALDGLPVGHTPRSERQEVLGQQGDGGIEVDDPTRAGCELSLADTACRTPVWLGRKRGCLHGQALLRQQGDRAIEMDPAARTIHPAPLVCWQHSYPSPDSEYRRGWRRWKWQWQWRRRRCVISPVRPAAHAAVLRKTGRPYGGPHGDVFFSIPTAAEASPSDLCLLR